MAKEKICGIYCIENLVNHKKYIGQSVNIKSRFRKHKNYLCNETHNNEHLQSAWNLYGENNFKFTIIEKCEKDMLDEKEIYYIAKLKTHDRMFGYNKTLGGDGVKSLSQECTDKLSNSKTLYPVLRFSLDGIFICEYRNCKSAADDVCGNSENIRMCCNKKAEHKTAYGSIWIYKYDYEENGLNLNDYIFTQFVKPVIQYDLNMNFIAEYTSAREAEKVTGIGYKMISRVCNYKRSHTHGFIFRFKNDLTPQN